MATAVAQLFMALPHSPSTWSLQHTGVVAFVKDNPQRSYFIRMFDLKVTWLWHSTSGPLSLYEDRYHVTTEVASQLSMQRGMEQCKSHVASCLLAPSSTGREAGVGAGALQPIGLFNTAAVLPHVCFWCKFHFKQVIDWVEIAVCLKWDYCVCPFPYRIAKLDLTLQSNKKQKLFKMLSMRKSASDRAGTVSESFIPILNIYFKNRRKWSFNLICSQVNNYISPVFLLQYKVGESVH